ncbi:MAG: hypothetical protein MHM6MM_003280 [Cercozoa sp. M6MM]
MESLVARLVPARHCFVSLPASMARAVGSADSNSGSIVFRLSWRVDNGETQSVFVGSRGGTCADGEIHIPTGLAQCLGVREGIRVRVTRISDHIANHMCRAKSLELEPKDADDFEIVSINAGSVEHELLGQIDVFNLAHNTTEFPLWVNGARVFLIARAPANHSGMRFVKLCLGDEVAVVPKVRPSSAQDKAPSPPVATGTTRATASEKTLAASPRTKTDRSPDEGTCLRVSTVPHELRDCVHTAHVLVAPSSKLADGAQVTVHVCSLNSDPTGDVNSDTDDASTNYDGALRFSARAHVCETVYDGHVAVGTLTRRALGLRVGAPVTLHVLNHSDNLGDSSDHAVGDHTHVLEVALIPLTVSDSVNDSTEHEAFDKSHFLFDLSESSDENERDGAATNDLMQKLRADVAELGADFVCRDGDFLGEARLRLVLSENRTQVSLGEVLRALNQDTCTGTLLAAKHVHAQAHDDTVEPHIELPEDTLPYALKLARTLVSPEFSALVAQKELCRTGVVFCGDCGKSHLASQLRHFLHEEAQPVYTEIVQCRDYGALSIAAAVERLRRQLRRAQQCAPSLVFLDDVDTLSRDAVVQWLRDQANTLASSRGAPVAFLASARSFHAVHAALRSFSVLCRKRELPSPRASHRRLALSVFSCKTNVSEALLDRVQVELGAEMRHFTLSQLRKLVARALHYANVRTAGDSNAPSDFTCDMCDFVRALESMHTTTEQIDQCIEWQYLGGLTQAKCAVSHMLDAPLRFRELWRRAPLPPQRGLLLFGAPGSGKTALACAAARRFHLNAILVKGPELLDKYIGASEENVRRVFEQARSQAPALVILDEIDALAPPRGASTTGVTDRVVNQLLTLLDGVEARGDVFVIGCTSRPDRVDPALLRPGRLDQIAECQLDSLEEAVAVLECTMRRLGSLADDIDLTQIARSLPQHSAADLAAVLSEAQLLAVQEATEPAEVSPKKLQPQSQQVQIARSHIESVLSTSHPSLRESEKMRFERIYSQFRRSRDGDVRADDSDLEFGTKLVQV